MHSRGIFLLILIALVSADLTCVPAGQLNWDVGLYPTLKYYLYSGGEPCFVGHMCSWYFQLIGLNSSVDLSLSVNFDPPLFFFLSTNSYT